MNLMRAPEKNGSSFSRIVLILIGAIAIPIFGAISPLGGFSYEFKLKLPPGRLGVMPNLKLTYNSHNRENGWLGQGWTLSGIPKIGRINYGRGVNYDGYDTFEASEGRLVPVPGEIDVYHTEYESWNKYKARNKTCGVFGNEPCWWQVTDRKGWKWNYTNVVKSVTNAYRNMYWYLKTVQDLNGNSLKINYFKPNGFSDIPRSIDYTLGGGFKHQRVYFIWENRPDKIWMENNKAQYRLERRIKEIHMYTGMTDGSGQQPSNLVRKYIFVYELNEDTQRSQIARIVEMGKNSLNLTPEDCSPETCLTTNFEYSEGSLSLRNNGFMPNDVSWGERHAAIEDDGAAKVYIDLNGDGLSDVLYQPETTRYQWAMINQGDNSFETRRWGNIQKKYKTNKGIRDYADVNGDGFTDLIYATKKNFDGTKKGTIRVMQGSADGFVSEKTWGGLEHRVAGKGTFRSLVDMNGDGYLDYVYQSAVDDYYYVLMNIDGERFEEYPERADERWGRRTYKVDRDGNDEDTFGTTRIFTDVNGDSLPDFVYMRRDYGEGFLELRVMLNEKNSFGPDTQALRLENEKIVKGYMGRSFVDVNADGLVDFIYQVRNTSQIRYLLNTGNGKFISKDGNDGFYWGTKDYAVTDGGLTRVFADINGDGFCDVLYERTNRQMRILFGGPDGSGQSPAKAATGDLYLGTRQNRVYAGGDVHFNNGHSTVRLSGSRGFADLNGDGQFDFLYFNKNSPDIQVMLFGGQFSPDSDKPAGLLTKVTNEIGGVTEVDYSYSLRETGVVNRATTCGGREETIDENNCGLPFIAPSHVVVSEVMKDGLGRSSEFDRIQTYSYENLRFFPGRRGNADEPVIQTIKLLGFESIIRKDEQLGSSQVTRHIQDHYDLIMRPKMIEVRDRKAKKVSAQEIDYRILKNRYDSIEVRIKRAVEERFDNQGNLLFRTTKKNNRFDEFGNTTKSTETNNDFERVITKNKFLNDPNKWVIGLLTRKTVEHNGKQYKRTDYSYDSNKYRLKKVKNHNLEGSSKTEIVYRYNSLGQKIKVIDELGRETNYEYDSAYSLFLEEAVDPLGYSEMKFFDSGTGNVIKTTDKNNQTTSHYYDDLGRKNRTDYPTGLLEIVEYHSWGNPLTQHIENRTTSSEGTVVSRQYIDGFQFAYRTENGKNPFKIIVLKERYFNNYLLYERESLPHFEGSRPQFTETRTNSRKQVTRRKVPGKVEKKDSNDRVADVTKYIYFKNNITETRAGYTKKTKVNYRGLLSRSTVQKEGTDHVTKYKHDPLGRLVKVTLPNGKTVKYAYNSLDQRVSLNDQLSGVSNYSFDERGNVIEKDDKVGATAVRKINYTYDELDRISEISYQKGLAAKRDKKINYVYDPSNGVGQLEYVKQGNPKTNGFKKRFKYNGLGQVKEVVHTIQGRKYTYKFGYDEFNEPILIEYPNGTTVRYIYKIKHGRRFLSKIKKSDEDGNVTLASYRLADYNAYEQIEEVEFGNDSSTSYTYNIKGLLETNVARPSLTAESQEELLNLAYSFDAQRNITSIADKRGNKVIAGKNTDTTAEYNYDEDSLLKTVSGAFNSQYRYDKIANMKRKGEKVFEFGSLNRLVADNAGNSYEYDALGNLSKVRPDELDGVTKEFYYNDENRLIRSDVNKPSEVCNSDNSPWTEISLPVTNWIGTPQVIYVGGSVWMVFTGSQILRSVNDGDTWFEVENMFTGSNLVAGFSDGTGYVATRESGTGNQHIYKSTDYGVEWVELVPPSNITSGSNPSSILVRDANTLYIQYGAEIFESVDGGIGWSKIHSGISAAAQFAIGAGNSPDIYLRGLNTNTNLAEVNKFGAFEVTPEKTFSFEGGLLTFGIARLDDNIVVSTTNGIYLSQDDISSFQRVLEVDIAVQAGTFIKKTTEDTAFDGFVNVTSGEQRLYRTEDMGETWQLKDLPDFWGWDFSFRNKEVGLVAGQPSLSDSAARLYKTISGGDECVFEPNVSTTIYLYDDQGQRLVKTNEYGDAGHTLTTTFADMYFEHRTTTEGSELYSLNIYDKAGKVLTTITKNGDYTEQVSGLVGLKYYNLYSEELAQLALTDLQQLGEAAQLVGLLTIYYPHKAGLLRIILVILLLVALGYLVWQTKCLNHLNRSPVLRLAPLPAFALCVTMMNCDHNGRLITGNTVPSPDSEDVINGMYYVEPGEATRLSTLEGLPLGTYYYHTDHLGSTSVVTDATGEEVTRIVYKPYGEIDHERSTGLHVVTHKFTGQEYDEETGLYYYGARYYDAGLGRFTTADTVVPYNGRDVIGFNNYAYARSNPVRYIDSNGYYFLELNLFAPDWLDIAAVVNGAYPGHKWTGPSNDASKQRSFSYLDRFASKIHDDRSAKFIAAALNKHWGKPRRLSETIEADAEFIDTFSYGLFSGDLFSYNVERHDNLFAGLAVSAYDLWLGFKATINFGMNISLHAFAYGFSEVSNFFGGGTGGDIAAWGLVATTSIPALTVAAAYGYGRAFFAFAKGAARGFFRYDKNKSTGERVAKAGLGSALCGIVCGVAGTL